MFLSSNMPLPTLQLPSIHHIVCMSSKAVADPSNKTWGHQQSHEDPDTQEQLTRLGNMHQNSSSFGAIWKPLQQVKTTPIHEKFIPLIPLAIQIKKNNFRTTHKILNLHKMAKCNSFGFCAKIQMRDTVNANHSHYYTLVCAPCF